MIARPLGGCRILVVEDDYMIARDVAGQLERAGAIVAGPVPSVAMAMRLLAKADQVDAAVLDVNLGQEDSFPIAQALQARGIPFLFCTGYNSADIPPAWRQVTTVMKPLKLAAVQMLLPAGDGA